MTPEEKRAKHAAYMRKYYADPKRRAKKQEKDRVYAAANRDAAKERARLHRAKDPAYKRLNVGRYQLDKKMKAVALLGSKCNRCGFDHPAALQFHHIDPTQKGFNVTTKQLASPRKIPWAIIEAEVAKCELLCANCHFQHHSQWTDEDIAEARERYR